MPFGYAHGLRSLAYHGIAVNLDCFHVIDLAERKRIRRHVYPHIFAVDYSYILGFADYRVAVYLCNAHIFDLAKLERTRRIAHEDILAVVDFYVARRRNNVGCAVDLGDPYLVDRAECERVDRHIDNYVFAFRNYHVARFFDCRLAVYFCNTHIAHFVESERARRTYRRVLPVNDVDILRSFFDYRIAVDFGGVYAFNRSERKRICRCVYRYISALDYRYVARLVDCRIADDLCRADVPDFAEHKRTRGIAHEDIPAIVDYHIARRRDDVSGAVDLCNVQIFDRSEQKFARGNVYRNVLALGNRKLAADRIDGCVARDFCGGNAFGRADFKRADGCRNGQIRHGIELHFSRNRADFRARREVVALYIAVNRGYAAVRKRNVFRIDVAVDCGSSRKIQIDISRRRTNCERFAVFRRRRNFRAVENRQFDVVVGQNTVGVAVFTRSRNFAAHRYVDSVGVNTVRRAVCRRSQNVVDSSQNRFCENARSVRAARNFEIAYVYVFELAHRRHARADACRRENARRRTIRPRTYLHIGYRQIPAALGQLNARRIGITLYGNRVCGKPALDALCVYARRRARVASRSGAFDIERAD